MLLPCFSLVWIFDEKPLVDIVPVVNCNGDAVVVVVIVTNDGATHKALLLRGKALRGSGDRRRKSVRVGLVAIIIDRYMVLCPRRSLLLVLRQWYQRWIKTGTDAKCKRNNRLLSSRKIYRYCIVTVTVS